MSKKLVAYFSASGITAKVAETLAEATGADIFEIQPEVPYTKADLNWQDKTARSTIEMQNPASRPAIAAKRENMADYDTIFCRVSDLVVCRPHHHQHLSGKLRPDWQDHHSICYIWRQRNGQDE